MLEFYIYHANHLTEMHGTNVTIDFHALFKILKDLEMLEQELCNTKINDNLRFRDEILESCSQCDENGVKFVNIQEYRQQYTNTHFPNEASTASAKFIEGMQWVLSYYTKGVPDWTWSYPYDYAPNLSNILSELKIKQRQKLENWRSGIKGSDNDAINPFHQLLFILPPSSSNLLPNPLNEALEKELKIYSPEKIEIDLSGKRQEWEGIVLLPKPDQRVVTASYTKYKPFVDKKHLSRDVKGRIFKYCDDKVYFLR
jgi:5'-3' exoribonuclease 1